MTCLKRVVSSPLPQQSSWRQETSNGLWKHCYSFIPRIHYKITMYTNTIRFLIMTYCFVENPQHGNGRVFTGRSWHIHSLDIGRVVEVYQFFGNLWTVGSQVGCFRDSTINRTGSLEQRRRWKINANIKHLVLQCVCGMLTVSLFMKPQMAAATSQAKRITKKKKNYRNKARFTIWSSKRKI